MSSLSLSAGSRLGPYEVLSPIGAGGMGEVYRARDTKLGREIAIKVLPEVFAQDNERRKRFDREAQSIAALNHPNIVHVQGGFSSCWSPDGTRLFFRGSGRGQICEISLKNRTERVVADLSDRLGRLGHFGALATDGDFLYFIWEEDEGDLWVMDVVESQ